MKNSMENISSEQTLRFFPEILTRFETEFADYKWERVDGSRKEHETLVRVGTISQGEMEQALSRQEKELSELNVSQRISRVLNNFYLWWPGGSKREAVDRKEKREGNTQTHTKSRQLIADFDECIHDAGYEPLTFNMLKDAEGRQTYLPELATIYLAMRDKGYTRSELTA